MGKQLKDKNGNNLFPIVKNTDIYNESGDQIKATEVEALSTEPSTGSEAKGLKINGVDWKLPSGGGGGGQFTEDEATKLKYATGNGGIGYTLYDKTATFDGSIEGKTKIVHSGDGYIKVLEDSTEHPLPTQPSSLIGNALKATVEGEEQTLLEEITENDLAYVEDESICVQLDYNPWVVITLKDNIKITIDEQEVTFPTKGVYFRELIELGQAYGYISSLAYRESETSTFTITWNGTITKEDQESTWNYIDAYWVHISDNVPDLDPENKFEFYTPVSGEEFKIGTVQFNDLTHEEESPIYFDNKYMCFVFTTADSSAVGGFLKKGISVLWSEQDGYVSKINYNVSAQQKISDEYINIPVPEYEDYQSNNILSINSDGNGLEWIYPSYMSSTDPTGYGTLTLSNNGSAIFTVDNTGKIKANSLTDGTTTKTITEVLSGSSDNKMDKENPTGTGYFSLNRKDGITVGNYSFACGSETTASEWASYAEGYNTSATNDCAHAEGYETTASGMYSHAEGCSTTASNYYAHAEGNGTTANGESSHAEGWSTSTGELCAHAEGGYTQASGKYSHAGGFHTIASGDYQYVSGRYNISDDISLFIIGNGESNTARSNAFKVSSSGAVQFNSLTDGTNSRTVTEILTSDASAKMDKLNPTGTGYFSLNRKASTTIGTDSFAEGLNGTASGFYSHAEGSGTVASGNSAHSEGQSTTANGAASHAEGNNTTASNFTAHAEGGSTLACGQYSHAEGSQTIASGNYSHAEGRETTADTSSHAEGYSRRESLQVQSVTNNSITLSAAPSISTTIRPGLVVGITTTNGEYNFYKITAVNNLTYTVSPQIPSQYRITSGWSLFDGAAISGSHTEGHYTTASGNSSHAEGWEAIASGDYSHAEGYYTTASGKYQHVSGKYNIVDTSNKYAEIIGNGESHTSRANARTLDWSGNEVLSGGLTINATAGIKIGNTVLDETKLQKLLALIEAMEA